MSRRLISLFALVALSPGLFINCSSGGNQQQNGTGGTTPGTGGAGALATGGTTGSGTGGLGAVDGGGTRTGNVAGSLGTPDAGTPGRTFPTQACLDKASALLAMMTDDKKIAQLHQVERANTNASDITTYDVGSVYS